MPRYYNGYDMRLSIRPPGFESESGPLFSEARSQHWAHPSLHPPEEYIGTSLAEHQGHDLVCIDWINPPEYVFAIQR